jgi:hypothetical protein
MMMDRRNSILLTGVLLSFLIGTGLKADVRESGGYAGSYLRMPVSARSAALGNAVGAIPGTAESFIENPALPAHLEYSHFGSSFQFLSLNRSLHMIHVAFPVPPSAGLALAWIHAGVANIEERDFSNRITGELQSSQDALYLGFANRIWKSLSLGINTKIFIDQLPDVSATGFGLDLGLYFTLPGELSLGFSIKDISSKINWNTRDLYEFGSQRTDSYPTLYQFSGTYLYEDILLVSAAYRGSFDIYPSVHLGLEIKAGEHFALRGGVDDRMPVFGLSTAYPVLGNVSTRIDYAFLLGRHNEGISHAFSWIFTF